MSNIINDGGCAFPSKYEFPEGSPIIKEGVFSEITKEKQTFINCGMSLRDWFAGMAMQGLVSATSPDGTWTGAGDDAVNKIVAKTSYALADAMIAER